jgi:hypothetical protein
VRVRDIAVPWPLRYQLAEQHGGGFIHAQILPSWFRAHEPELVPGHQRVSKKPQGAFLAAIAKLASVKSSPFFSFFTGSLK